MIPLVHLQHTEFTQQSWGDFMRWHLELRKTRGDQQETLYQAPTQQVTCHRRPRGDTSEHKIFFRTSYKFFPCSMNLVPFVLNFCHISQEEPIIYKLE